MALSLINTGTTANDGTGDTLRAAHNKINDNFKALSGYSYDTRALAAAASISVVIDHVRTVGYASVGDGGGGNYKRVSSEPSHAGKFQSADSAWWELVDAVVSPLQFGAAFDGTTDDTTAWSNAISVGREVSAPSGATKITGMLTLQEGQTLRGQSRVDTYFVIDDDFDLGDAAVVTMEDFSGLIDIGMRFDQSAAALSGLRSDLIAYPWAISIAAATRVIIDGVRLSACYKGINGVGNCGGSFINRLECGAFHTGMDLDGPLDTIHLSQIHMWPFDFAGDSALLGIYSDGTTIGVDIGAVDDIEWSGGILFRSKLNLTGPSFGNITALAMDGTYSSINATGEAEITFSSGYSTTAGTDDYHLNVTAAAELTFNGFDFENGGGSGSVPLFRVNSATAEVRLSDCHITVSGTGTTLAELTSGRLFLSDSYVNAGVSARPAALIDINGGRIFATGNFIQDIGAASEWINISTDAYHFVRDNIAPAWTMVAPSSSGRDGVYGPNQCATRVSNGNVTGAHKVTQLTGTLDGSGNVTIAHGIASLHTRLLHIHAHRLPAECAPITHFITAIDGTNVTITTATAGWAGHPVQVTVTHT